MKKGKLVVIDGSDGVGKATQTKLLVKRLKKEKIPVATLDFPQYTHNFFGSFIKECLAGKYGDFIALDPHIASVLYAADRFESKKKIEKWLAEGKIVVLDRYVSANQMHQGGKIQNTKERKRFLTWLDTLEHRVFRMPRPDGILYLHLPTELSLVLIDKRGAKDLAETNVRYLSRSRQNALRLIQSSARWEKINCAEKGKILSREKIHEMVYAATRKIVGIY
jgi:dTMP kinase